MKVLKENLGEFTQQLEEDGYKRYGPCSYKNEDYSYFKSFKAYYDEDGDKIPGYQIALLFYDFSKYVTGDSEMSIQFEFILGHNNGKFDRADFTISDDKMSVDRFEGICYGLYDYLKSEET